MAMGEDSVRGCGEDAVRVVVGVKTEHAFRPLHKSRKLLRTAPTLMAHDVRVGVFLTRLVEALREAAKRARVVETCRACGSPMAERKGKHGAFLGCTSYPQCRETRRLAS
jgi:hypothetical protein